MVGKGSSTNSIGFQQPVFVKSYIVLIFHYNYNLDFLVYATWMVDICWHCQDCIWQLLLGFRKSKYYIMRGSHWIAVRSCNYTTNYLRSDL